MPPALLVVREKSDGGLLYETVCSHTYVHVYVMISGRAFDEQKLKVKTVGHVRKKSHKNSSSVYLVIDGI